MSNAKSHSLEIHIKTSHWDRRYYHTALNMIIWIYSKHKYSWPDINNKTELGLFWFGKYSCHPPPPQFAFKCDSLGYCDEGDSVNTKTTGWYSRKGFNGANRCHVSSKSTIIVIFPTVQPWTELHLSHRISQEWRKTRKTKVHRQISTVILLRAFSEKREFSRWNRPWKPMIVIFVSAPTSIATWWKGERAWVGGLVGLVGWWAGDEGGASSHWRL